MQEIKTITDVKIEIARAVLIMKSMPKDGPRKITSFWPSFQNDNLGTEDADSADNALEYFRPLPEEIDDMDTVFEKWFQVLDCEEKKLVFQRASGRSWKCLLYRFGSSRSSLYDKYRRCLIKILQYTQKEQSKQVMK